MCWSRSQLPLVTACTHFHLPACRRTDADNAQDATELSEGDLKGGSSKPDLPEDAIQDRPPARVKPRLPTEDDFMNLEEMEAFVNQAEAEEAEDEDESAEDESDGAEAEDLSEEEQG